MTTTTQTVPLSCVVELTRNVASLLNSLADSVAAIDVGVPTISGGAIGTAVSKNPGLSETVRELNIKDVPPTVRHLYQSAQPETETAVDVDPNPPVVAEAPAEVAEKKERKPRRTKAEIEAEAKAAQSAAPQADEPEIPAFLLKNDKTEVASDQEPTPAAGGTGLTLAKDAPLPDFKKVVGELCALGGKYKKTFTNDVIPILMGTYKADTLASIYEGGQGYEFFCDLEKHVLDAQKAA